MAEGTPQRKRLYFFWDYDIAEDDLRAILCGDNEVEKAWAITRLLEAARWEDIWKYITLRDVHQWFPRLKMWRYIRSIWDNALIVLGAAGYGPDCATTPPA